LKDVLPCPLSFSLSLSLLPVHHEMSCFLYHTLSALMSSLTMPRNNKARQLWTETLSQYKSFLLVSWFFSGICHSDEKSDYYNNLANCETWVIMVSNLFWLYFNFCAVISETWPGDMKCLIILYI
jgi:hypothetical protein